VIALQKLADLDLSAASGLIRLAGLAFVVADDEHVLDGYDISSGTRRHRMQLPASQPLPEEHHERKRLKPDLETLALLPDRQLLTLGSGSTERRETGYLIRLSNDSNPLDPVRPVELSPLYRELRTRFRDLNIEGAAAAGGLLRLLQRGNGRAAENAVIDLDLAGVLQSLEKGRSLDGALIRAVRPVALGALDGIPLGFTDASPLEPESQRIVFVAAAEDTDDPYEDGACPGSVVGVLDESGSIVKLERLEGSHKIEGVSVVPGLPVLMVADPDDRSKAAPLLEAASFM